MFMLQRYNWFNGAFRTVMTTFDMAVYGFLATNIKIYFYLGQFQLFATDVLGSIRNRLFILIAVIMIFVVSASFLSEIVSREPNLEHALTNKTLIRVITALGLLIFVPTVMDTFLYGTVKTRNKEVNVQEAITQLIPKLIIGEANSKALNDSESINDKDTQNNQSNIGEYIAGSVYGAFWSIGEDCEDEVDEMSDLSIWYWNDHVNDKCASNQDLFKYEYIHFIPFFFGLWMAFTIGEMSVKLVLRALKLQFLQMISPIPIILYVKDDTALKRWFRMLMKTYLEFYIRLAVFYLIIFLICNFEKINFPKPPTGFLSWGRFYAIFIIGLISAIKLLPDFIVEALGLSDKNGFGKELMGELKHGFETTKGAFTAPVKGAVDGAKKGFAKGGVPGAVGGAVGGAALGGLKNQYGGLIESPVKRDAKGNYHSMFNKDNVFGGIGRAANFVKSGGIKNSAKGAIQWAGDKVQKAKDLVDAAKDAKNGKGSIQDLYKKYSAVRSGNNSPFTSGSAPSSSGPGTTTNTTSQTINNITNQNSSTSTTNSTSSSLGSPSITVTTGGQGGGTITGNTGGTPTNSSSAGQTIINNYNTTNNNNTNDTGDHSVHNNHDESKVETKYDNSTQYHSNVTNKTDNHYN